MPEQKKLIQFKNIVKSFEDGQVVLKGVSLDIYENEFVTLLGPSGCGKTTLLRILGGFLQPTEGKVLFDGEDIVNVPPYKREINTVFQKYALFPHMNVYDNIAFGLRIAKDVEATVTVYAADSMHDKLAARALVKHDVAAAQGRVRPGKEHGVAPACQKGRHTAAGDGHADAVPLLGERAQRSHICFGIHLFHRASSCILSGNLSIPARCAEIGLRHQILLLSHSRTSAYTSSLLSSLSISWRPSG